LAVKAKRELGGKRGSTHYHLGLPGRPETLELSELSGRVWFSINERRDCGWVSQCAPEIATTVAGA